MRSRARGALALVCLAPLLRAQAPPVVEPPPVDEAALAQRLLEMTQPQRGERAVVVYDPTYYPGITTRLREALEARGVHTIAIAEETPELVAAYVDDEAAQLRREQEVVATLGPLFRAADIFYWMPVRGYAGDMRWERLVADSRVRSVHFHWILGFPGSRTAEQVVATSRDIERRALAVDLADHARRQRQLADALRGQRVRITTPGGTDLGLEVAADEWFHFGDGDASRARLATARSVRDRQQELPVGMLVFSPDPVTVAGTILVPAIIQAGDAVKDVRLRLRQGRIEDISGGTGGDWIRTRIGVIGPDGDRFAAVSLNTNPLATPDGLVVVLGSNWEEAEPRRRNRPTRIRRLSIRLSDATLTAGDRTLVRDGRIQWDAF